MAQRAKVLVKCLVFRAIREEEEDRDKWTEDPGKEGSEALTKKRPLQCPLPMGPD